MSWPEDDRSIVKMLQDQQSHAWQACRDFFLKKYVKKGYPEKVKEDVVQSALIKVYQSLKDFSFKGSLAGWLGIILTTTVIDFARQERRRDANVSSLDSLQQANEKELEIAVETTPEADTILREEIGEAADGYWEWLKRKYPKTARRDFEIWRRHLHGYSVKQIADYFQLKEHTIRHALRKATRYFAWLRSQLRPTD